MSNGYTAHIKHQERLQAQILTTQIREKEIEISQAFAQVEKGLELLAELSLLELSFSV